MLNVKRISFIILMLVSPALFFSFTPLNKTGYRIRTVVIDAGHGGHDSGCLGSESKEKHIALSIALKLGKMIEERYPDIKVVYTRKTDVFVELRERAEIANKKDADLFICIHCNSGNKAAYGVETFVMGLHKTDDNLSVSKRENASILLEKDYKQNYDGYDPNSPESNIIFNLYQNLYMEKSLTFASKVQANVVENAGRYSRGVKQAGFLVLYKTAMPSVLIETGFLTNANDEKYLLSEKGQAAMVTSIFRAFKEYKTDMEEGDNNDTTYVEEPKVSEATNAIVSEKEKEPAKSTPEPKKEEPPTPVKPLKTKDVPVSDIKETAKKADSLSSNKTTTVSNPKIDKNAPKGEARTDIKVEPPVFDKVENTKNNNLENGFFYTVQIGATPEVTEAEKKKYETAGEVTFITAEDGKMQRITVGHFDTYEKAVSMQNKLRSKGFADAFITPYNKGKRITVKEAKALGK
jgi:N-acetylmuramoyl-L-alanine amidase